MKHTKLTHYHPFGGIIPDISANQTLQPYKYNGKEDWKMNYIYIILLLFMVSCDKSSRIQMALNEETQDAVSDYISKNEGYKSYLLFPSRFLFNDRKEFSGLLIGPLYKDVFDDGTIVGSFVIHNKRVFVMSDYSDFLKHNMEIEFCPKDSVDIQYGDIKIYNPLINYIKRAYLLYYKNNALHINYRPDTLFLPKINNPVNLN